MKEAQEGLGTGGAGTGGIGNWGDWKLEGLGTLPGDSPSLLPAAWGAHQGRDVHPAHLHSCRGTGSKGSLCVPQAPADLCGSALPSHPWHSLALVQSAFDTSSNKGKGAPSVEFCGLGFVCATERTQTVILALP